MKENTITALYRFDMTGKNKPFEDLIEIIHFTESVATKIRGIPDENKIFTLATKEFAKSQKYDLVIFVLAEPNSKLRIAATSIDPKVVEASEKATRVPIEGYRASVTRSDYLTQVIKKKKTLRIDAHILAKDLFPESIAALLVKGIGIKKNLIIMAPIIVKNQVIGALATISTQLSDHFIPSVNNLAQHISNALERSREYTKLKQAREQIYKLNQYLESIIDNANVWLNVLDENSNVVIWNKAAERISGYTQEEVVDSDKVWAWLYPDEKYRNKITQKAAAIIEKGELVEDFETIIQRKDKQKRTIAWHSRNLVDDKGKPIGSIALGRDITKRKRAEEQLQNSLKEKELFLKEIHYRINNNMQVISSILSLQSSFIKSRKTRDIFKQSQSRIRSVALIHEQLYQSGDLTSIDFSQYIWDLGIYLFQTYKIDPGTVRLNIVAGNMAMDINTALPCGLIINELLSNALRHAFPEQKASLFQAKEQGEVRIRFTSDKKGQYSLIMSDNGIGLPEDLDFQNTESLGLQLVNMMAYQIKASINLRKKPGTTFKITFKENKHSPFWALT